MEREAIFKELRLLTDAIAVGSRHEDFTFDLYGIRTTVTYCDGRLLLLLWYYDGAKDIAFPMHQHKDTVENIGLLQGTKITILCNGQEAILSSPGDSCQLPANTPHQIQYKMADGPCAGWAILVPPEPGLIPTKEEDGVSVCMLSKTGRCGSSPIECAKRKLQIME
jgi:quercetin dioxygenase-like cupin family protein